MRRILRAVALLAGIAVLTTVPATAGPGDWIKQRQDGSYHFVEQWSDYLHGVPETTPQHPHAVNPTDCQWTYDDEVTNTWANGVLAPGESVSFSECYLSDFVERFNQAQASSRSGPLQVTVTVANQYHSRTSTEMGETCVVGPAYGRVVWWDHDSPYAHFVVGSNEHPVGLHDPGPVPDDGGWAVGPTTITVTVTNTGTHTAREVGIYSVIGRPYNQLPPRRLAACDGLPVTPYDGFEPQWRS